MRSVVNAAMLALFLISLVAMGAAGKETAEPASAQSLERLPLAKQVEVKRTEFLAELERLQTAFSDETDPDTALQLQRQITAHKLNFEIGLHQLQLAHFLKAGDTERVESLRVSIEALQEMLPVIDLPELTEEGK